MKYVTLGILTAWLTASLAACSSSGSSGERERERERVPATRVADPGDAIDQELDQALMVAHHKAKVYMADGNLGAAIAAVRQILSLPFPRGAAEADDVRNDARALLAKLQISQGQIEEAAHTIDEGLAQSQRESFFVANLYTVQGEIHEARAAAFAATGEPGRASANEERRAAIGSYDHSIQINERLQKKLMEER
jgi:tetratricopeptide (TPR) repeat protein